MIRIMDEYAFFFPMYDDPMHGWLWGKEVTTRARLHALWRELRRAHRGDTRRPLRRFPYARHALASKRWYYQRLRQSYCIHLWESLWWANYLQALTPADRAGPGLFWQALREILPDDALMPLHISLQNSEVARPPLRACIDVRAVL
jgi:hypothetical protein